MMGGESETDDGPWGICWLSRIVKVSFVFDFFIINILWVKLVNCPHDSIRWEEEKIVGARLLK